MSISSFLKQALTWWNGATVGTRLLTWRRGEEVGRDEQGNIYYQAEGGRRRWVVYEGEAEASRIPPEWHGWLQPHLARAAVGRPPVPNKPLGEAARPPT